ncbi:MAG TPA: hypothetical protein PKE45_16930 [Caldilineaceae bacterium]|nr:hypothetical protein [Caldilineaceae bacterium]
MNWIIPLLIVIGLALLGLYFYERSRPKLTDNRDTSTDRVYVTQGQADMVDPDDIRHGEFRTVPDSTKGDYSAAEEDQHLEYDEVQERAVRRSEE